MKRHSTFDIRQPLCIVHYALCIALAAATASAANRFVSTSGTWIPDGREGTCYTDLRTALNAASSGDTIWLQDGTVVWNNTAATADASIVATNSCASYLTNAHGPDNIASDPLFADSAAGDYTLTHRSRCRNAAKLFDWMTDDADPRSRDLLGLVRLGGVLPDMGCYEYPFGKKTLILLQ